MRRRPQRIARFQRHKIGVTPSVLKTASLFRLVLVTVGHRENGHFISQKLVSERLAACVSMIPNVYSTYRWKEKIENASEFLLIIKTRKKNVAALHKRVRALHTYETPEFLTVSLEQGDSKYLAWLGAETEPKRKGRS